MNLDIDSCENIETVNNLYKNILEKKNNLVELINQGFEKAFIGIETINDLVKHYSSPNSKLVFSEIAKLTNRLKFYTNALNQVEDKQELLRKTSLSVHNKMI